MMRFDIITIFPHIFDDYFHESIIKRAQKRRLIKIHVHDLRDWTEDTHKTVDDKPFGGGPGMVMMVGPIYEAVRGVRIVRKVSGGSNLSNKRSDRTLRTKTILFSVKGKKFDQTMARQFSKLDQLIMICGRYEGVDERVARHVADLEVSVGDYVLTGGELPAMVVVDAVTRLIPGVIKEESIEEKRFKEDLRRSRRSDFHLSSYPAYTRPEVFSPRKGVLWPVPRLLLSGDHKKIEEWRKKQIKRRVVA